MVMTPNCPKCNRPIDQVMVLPFGPMHWEITYVCHDTSWREIVTTEQAKLLTCETEGSA